MERLLKILSKVNYFSAHMDEPNCYFNYAALATAKVGEEVSGHIEPL